MCRTDSPSLASALQLALGSREPLPGADAAGPAAAAAGTRSAGSRRRRLWELGSHAHCPVVGVCLPIDALRRQVDKVLGGQAVAEDYELHCGAIAECRTRTPVAEALQRELDRRYALALRQAAKAKTAEALATWWAEASQGPDLAGALWAALTHARCDPTLEHQVLGEVHMLQHQVGMARRVDLQRFEALIEENGVLARELAAAQQRSQRVAAEQARRLDDLQAEAMQLRGQLMVRDTTIAGLQGELQALNNAAPDLKSRFELAREAERLLDQQHNWQRALLQARQEAERQRQRADQLAALLAQRRAEATLTAADAAEAGPQPAPLDDRAVLCVGGRTASVPLYRSLIERTGGRFLHHDGGAEDHIARLEASLAAADLVICQTGCVSHDAYWRVKDHCKRTGKRCVFVENPSSAGFRRALCDILPIAGAAAGNQAR
jgi:hypothetical protein